MVTSPKQAEIEVRIEVNGENFDLEKANRIGRRMLTRQIEKFRKKFKDVVGPGGERPTIIMRTKNILSGNFEVVIEYPESMKNEVVGHENAVRVDT